MIATLTDFGNSEYLGAMKGVIRSISFDADIIDLYNDVAPQSVRQAAWVLLSNYACFPKGALFLCIVDPGVGTDRKALAVQTKSYTFIAPDNGLIYPAAQKDGITSVISITIPKDASRTFHGRDICAKAAAKLDSGHGIASLGKPAKTIQPLHFHKKGREGEVVRIDHFGNIITNLSCLPGEKRYAATLGKEKMNLPFYATYAEAKSDELFLIEGSARTLEISVKSGSAKQKLHPKIGEHIRIIGMQRGNIPGAEGGVLRGVFLKK